MAQSNFEERIDTYEIESTNVMTGDRDRSRYLYYQLKMSMAKAKQIDIIVSFLMESGVRMLLNDMKRALERGVKIRILTGNYLGITQPSALYLIKSELGDRVDLRLYNETSRSFHPKSYIFHYESSNEIYIGSSNISKSALTSGIEWNYRFSDTLDKKNYELFYATFEDLFLNHSIIIDDEELKRYSKAWKKPAVSKDLAKYDAAEENEDKNAENVRMMYRPRGAQIEALYALQESRMEGAAKGLVYAATGIGKTYLAAFDSAKYERVLFVAHREEILKQAAVSFKNVRNSEDYGFFDGKEKDTDKSVIFASVATLGRPEYLNETYFPADYFDYVIIDEFHHAVTDQYRRIVEYFQPQFLLGLTATPERMDGKDIYEICDYNVPYQISLKKAINKGMLVPFHYYGVYDETDYSGLRIVKGRYDERELNQAYIGNERRYNLIYKYYRKYRSSRAIGFCCSRRHAEDMAKEFCQRGVASAAVYSGGNGAYAEERNEAIRKLKNGEIRVIFSVDMFNEGVDVPEINQVIMLRPTESPIVFIQQLGRGLRKAENKVYVVVLDFIGNYRNNFMIPIALSGDRSYNKDNIRRYVTGGGRVIPGASTIHFDEISRKRIFQAIDNANFSDIKLIRENYTNLKNKLGHIPALADFDKYGEMDVLRIFDNNSFGSYYKFLVKYEKEYTIRLSEDEEKAIEFISKKLASGKRIHELELLKRTLQYHHGIIGRLQKHLSEKYHCEMDEYCTENVINMMTNEFPTSAAKKTYAQCVFLKKEQDDYGISDSYEKMLQNPEFCAILEELVDFGISRYKVNYSYQYQDTNLVLYQKYTYEDACRLLNWERNEVPLNIGGYKYDKKTKTFPIFINYDKQDNISDTTKYEDHFVAENRLIAISKSGRSMDSEDVQNFLNATERGIDVQLFVRKNKDDKISKEFYYLGRVIATGNAKQFVMPNTDKTAVEIEWELETPVREDIYQYIVNEMKKNSNLKYKFEFFFSS
ncbi:DUF3427 domain-containing protein [Dorea sp. Marseille-P4042]|uniref:DUF3427 domain-containing protein n=1 Tax=Dorea sp. Marseille-P4042 TaxID=2080749 RepID=UPI000CF9C67D|nr:DUF3427 domain-containing protein [Dorea sp. Marseille-P4042]